MTALLLAGLIAGVLCPPVVSFLKSDKFPTQLNQAIAVVVCLAAAAVATAVTGGSWTVAYFLSQATAIFSVSQIVYAEYFRSSPLETFLAGLFSALKKDTKDAVTKAPPWA